MTLEEIETLARSARDGHEKRIADIYECGRMEAIRTLEQLGADSTNESYDLARAVLAMLPVVKAAEAQANYSGLSDKHEATLMRAVADAIDTMRAALGASHDRR